MEGAKKSPLKARKKPMRKNKRLVRSIVAYLKSDAYLYAPLFSNSDSSTEGVLPVTGVEKVKNNRGRMSEKVKEYLNSDCYMHRPMLSPPKLGKLQVTNLVTMEVSTSTTTMSEGNNKNGSLRSDSAEHSLHNRRINSPRRALVILEGQRTGLSRETDLSPPFFSPPDEKMAKPDPRRVRIE